MSEASNFYKQFIGPADLVFDVGANCGSRTEVFSMLAHKVVAVEPLEAIYAVLKTVFQYNEKVVAVKKACGSGLEEPYSKIRLYNEAMPMAGISSMSPAWIEAVRETGRFTACLTGWETELDVEMTTLDKLMLEFGRPTFIKIDVEGYEPEVLSGLSSPVRALSFEFTPERLEDSFLCIDRCVELGMSQFSVSTKENFDLSGWQDGAGVNNYLTRFIGDSTLYGDVYARVAP